jgi:hypothetical protein
MIDLGQYQADATEWGISLRERFELDVHVREGLKSLDEMTKEDCEDEEFRGKVGDVLIANHLFSKAKRYMECSRFGCHLQCQGEAKHEFFSPLYCDLRFCPRCGPRQYARLVAKYSPVLTHVRTHPQRDYLLRELTLTSRNTGTLTSEQIRMFNEFVKKTLEKLMVGVKGWGAIWCDEVGFDNTNLHAHVLFYGPFVEQKRLAAVWRQISGFEVVYIRKAHTRGSLALRHLLKYVSKPPSRNPEIVGLLEVAFHGRRRVHAIGLFYNFAGDDPDNLASKWVKCPECGAPLTRLPGTHRIEELALQGLEFIGSIRPKRRNKWIN